MNRIQMLDQVVTPSENSSPAAQVTRLRSNSRRALEYSFFVPLHYEANYAYPLLVWLHGPDDDQRQLKRVMPHVSMRNYVGVAPAFRSTPVGAEPSLEASPWPQTSTEISQALESVLEVVEQAKQRFHVASQRIFLAGYDSGGTMAIRLGLSAPNEFAGVASLAGPFPSGHQPLANLPQVRKLPILIAHGRESEAYPVGQLCDDLRLFHVAGMSLSLRQYGCGHELTTQMLSDLDAWMMQIVTGNTMSSESSVDSTTWSDEWN